MAIWRRRPLALLDLRLAVVLCAWPCDVALAAMLNAGRFDLAVCGLRAIPLSA